MRIASLQLFVLTYTCTHVERAALFAFQSIASFRAMTNHTCKLDRSFVESTAPSNIATYTKTVGGSMLGKSLWSIWQLHIRLFSDCLIAKVHGRRRRPPPITLSILDPKKDETYAKIYRNVKRWGGETFPKILRKST